jgi:hypothetical protein
MFSIRSQRKFDKQYVIDVVRGVRMENSRPHF